MDVNDSMEVILRQMDLWYRSILGTAVLEAERIELNRFLPNYSGQHLLQMGGPSEFFLFEKSPIMHRTRLSPEGMPSFHGPSVQGSFKHLPFLPESLDVVLLPHLLEFVTDPEVILQQAYISLAPEGRLFVLGFNPYSLWGLSKYFSKNTLLPLRGRFRTLSTICQGLRRQQFIIEEQRTLFFRPPCIQQRALTKLLLLEVLGRLLWANCGGIYLIVAKKNIASLIPPDQINYKAPLFNSCPAVSIR